MARFDQKVDAHEAAMYVENMTNLANEAHVTAERPRRVTIKGIRKKADGTTREVTVELRDNGLGTGEHR